MKRTKLILSLLSLGISISMPLTAEEKAFEYRPGEDGAIENDSIIGIGFSPKVYLNLSGLLDSDTPVSDLATNEHDPQRDYQIHPIELSSFFDFSDQLRGELHGIALQSMDKDWELALEQIKLSYDINDSLTIGGGQLFNRFGFQNQNCAHAWDFINQHLQNSRILAEGELTTRGIELNYNPNKRLSFNITGGKTRVHEHDHGHHGDHDDHQEEGHHADHEGEDHEDHHIEADGINISDWIASTDVRYYLDKDQTLMVSSSLAVGENEFGTKTWLYGVGLQKLWGGHDHGNGLEFCEGGTKVKAEAIGRSAEIRHEDGDSDDVSDWGVYASIFYGLDGMATISARHGYVSGLKELELEDRHRTSLALSRNLSDNVLARVQYDYNRSDSIEGGDMLSGYSFGLPLADQSIVTLIVTIKSSEKI